MAEFWSVPKLFICEVLLYLKRIIQFRKMDMDHSLCKLGHFERAKLTLKMLPA